jgi:phage terminase large subunit-like protein
LVSKTVTAAGHFRDIALFEEDKATGHRQQRQLIGSDKVFTHAQTDNHRATGTRASSVDGSRESMITVPYAPRS